MSNVCWRGGAWKCTCVEQHKSEVLSCNLRRGHGWPRLSVEHLFPWSLVYLPRGCLYGYFIFFTYVHLGLPIELRLNQLLPRCLYNSHLLCPKYIYIYILSSLFQLDICFHNAGFILKMFQMLVQIKYSYIC
jgi:hypothetical protein